MNWPQDKEFAFTIIDDTDNASTEKIKPVYDYLVSKGFKTTKTIWIYPSRDNFTGQTIQDGDYLEFLHELELEGFEIQLHNVGSGRFNRQEIIEGFEIFKRTFARYPSLQINHASNPDNIYWGFKRFGPLLKLAIKTIMGNKRIYYGDVVNSIFFGEILQKNILNLSGIVSLVVLILLSMTPLCRSLIKRRNGPTIGSAPLTVILLRSSAILYKRRM